MAVLAPRRLPVGGPIVFKYYTGRGQRQLVWLLGKQKPRHIPAPPGAERAHARRSGRRARLGCLGRQENDGAAVWPRRTKGESPNVDMGTRGQEAELGCVGRGKTKKKHVGRVEARNAVSVEARNAVSVEARSEDAKGRRASEDPTFGL